MLATGAEPVPAHALERRLGSALVVGGLAQGADAAGVCLRPELAQMAALPMFWGKLGFAAAWPCLRAGRCCAGAPLVRTGGACWVGGTAGGPGLGPGGWALLQSPEADRWGWCWAALGACPSTSPCCLCPCGIACFGFCAVRLRQPAWPGRGWCGVTGRCRGALVLRSALPRDGAALFGGVVRRGHDDSHRAGGPAGAASAALVGPAPPIRRCRFPNQALRCGAATAPRLRCVPGG